MSRAARLAVLVVAVASLATGCRGGAPAAAPTDPLGGIESRVDQIAKQIDKDGTG